MPGPDLTHMLPCSSLPEAPSWLTMLQGDSGHRIQTGSFLSGMIFQHLCQEGFHPHTPLHQLLRLQCAFSACDRLLELLRAAGETAEKQKTSQGHGKHNRVQSRAGMGTCRVALHTHMRGIGPECSHTNPAMSWLLLQPIGEVKM